MTEPRLRWPTVWLAIRSLAWTVLLPGLFAGYLPWRFFGLADVQLDLQSPVHLLGLVSIGLGTALLGACIWEFARTGRGTLAPVDPPRELVVRGLYRYVRNPMYLSVTVIVLGELLLTRSRPLLAYWAIWFIAVNLFVIGYEEPSLRHRFGAAYERYAQDVGRWLPRLRPRRPRGIGVVLVAFLCGCAASTRSPAVAEEIEPDCSFRSPATCWTVSGRFPVVRSQPAAAPRERTPRQASPVLATEADTARSSR